MGSVWGQSEVSLGSVWGQSGGSLESVWGQSGGNLESVWGQSGESLGLVWVSLESVWGQSGVSLGSVEFVLTFRRKATQLSAVSFNKSTGYDGTQRGQDVFSVLPKDDNRLS